MYRGNVSEFGTGLSTILEFYIYPGMISLFVLCAIGIFLPKKYLSVYSSMIFAIGILIWLQGNILIWNYGVFDGVGIDWSRYPWQGLFDAGLWIVVILSAIILYKKVSRIILLVSPVIIILQSLLLIIAYITDPAMSSSKYILHAHVPEGLYNYSSSSNIIHIIFDGFQTDVFEEIVEEKRMWSDFDGFILYRENMAAFGTTTLSYPAIFSGESFQGNMEMSSYVNEALSERGFYNRLFEKGYTVNFVPGITVPENNITNFYDMPRVYRGTKRKNEISDAAVLMDVALFRHLPHYLKKAVYDDQNWFIARGLKIEAKTGYYHHKEFYEDYIENLRVTDSRPAYHFIHLLPPHPPFVTGQNCEYTGKVLPSNRDNYKKEADCVLSMFTQFLGKLKSLGVYDSSFIILQADHGYGFPPSNMKNDLKTDIDPGLVGRSLALLAIKPEHSKGSMKISSVQTSVTDVYHTVMKVAGLDKEYDGTSILELDSDKERERWLFSVAKDNKTSQLTRYLVTGSVYDYRNWNRVIKNVPPAHSYAKTYEWESDILFGILGNARPYQRKGWSAPEDEFTWTDGESAVLEIPVRKPNSEMITLIANVRPLLYSGKIAKQTVEIFVNGTAVGRWILSRGGFHYERIYIPAGLINKTGNMVVTFKTPDATSPDTIEGYGHDSRRLGIAVNKILLTEGRVGDGR